MTPGENTFACNYGKFTLQKFRESHERWQMILNEFSKHWIFIELISYVKDIERALLVMKF